jgi:F-type H+-transporting ATPase subunit epsilon
MSPIRVEIVTVERKLFDDNVDMVIVPGMEGEMGILPRHAHLLATLTFGELRIKKGNSEESFAIGGGFIEVRPDHVVVLADSAERAEDIDLERADAARHKAESLLSQGHRGEMDYARAEMALRRSMTRLKVGRRKEGKMNLPHNTRTTV